MKKRGSRRDASGRMDPDFRRRRRVETVLAELGMWNAFAAMPKYVQDQFLPLKFPDPILEFDPSFPKDAAHNELRKTLEAAFRNASLVIGDSDIAVRDFYSVIIGLGHAKVDLRDLTTGAKACEQFVHYHLPLLRVIFEKHQRSATDALHASIIVPLVAQSRIDSRLLTTRFSSGMNEHNKCQVRMMIQSDEPQVRRVQLDGESRPMYRVASCNEWTGPSWLSWNAAEVGLASTSAELPVYVQSHALRNLRQRANLPTMSKYLDCWLYESLKHPNIVQRQGNDLLVEFRVQKDRIGYFVVTPQKDLVAVRTFLFLTMEPSPEFRQLKKRLRLTRRDIDWLGLSDLTAFTQTDLKDDPVLRPLLEACNCGHLFELNDEDYAPQTKALAAEVKRYLRLAA